MIFSLGEKMKKLFLTLSFLSLTNLIFASGFALYEFSARGNAMGGAVLAGEAEPASLALNPALITELPSSQLQIGITGVTATGGITYGPYTGSSKRQYWPLPTFYYTQQISDTWWAGIGAFPRFGLSNDYEDPNWTLSSGSSLKHVGIVSYSIQPTVAFKATERLALSAGLEIQYINFTEKIRFGIPSNYSDLNLDGDSISTSGIFALFYKANEKVNFGASFRMRNNHSVKGPNKYDVNDLMFQSDGDFWGDISFPAQLALGASWKPTDKLLLEFNWTNVFWSSFKSIDIYFDRCPDTGTPGILNEETTDLNNAKHYQDAYRIGVGIEYTLTDTVKLRSSFIFDKSPINDEFMDVMLPVDDRYIIGAGAGFQLTENTILDLSYSLLFASPLDGVGIKEKGGTIVQIPVHYNNATSHFIGLSIRYKF